VRDHEQLMYKYEITLFMHSSYRLLLHRLFVSGMQPMAPAIMQVNADVKTMMWPLDYCPPGQTVPPTNDLALTRVQQEPYKGQFDLVNIPSAVVAVRIFGDALVEPNVRRVDNELRAVLRRDGLIPASTDGNNSPGQKNAIMFAQYDAVYSMGQRRSEVHIPLQDGGHPW
jgi:SOUL heme-binding protein